MPVLTPKLGPLDYGRRLSYQEFIKADYELGYKYELINGELYVLPLSNLPEDIVEKWLYHKLYHYSLEKPKVINRVTDKARVFLPRRRRVTAPEPDIAAYHAFPLHLPIRRVGWKNVSPLLVAEIVSAHDANKDFIRNAALYLQVPSIQEYWILDTREDPEEPSMRVHRRRGLKWKVIDYAYGDTYTTRLLPGFRLLIDPRK